MDYSDDEVALPECHIVKRKDMKLFCFFLDGFIAVFRSATVVPLGQRITCAHDWRQVLTFHVIYQFVDLAIFREDTAVTGAMDNATLVRTGGRHRDHLPLVWITAIAIIVDDVADDGVCNKAHCTLPKVRQCCYEVSGRG
jgi:hypothetical protein